MLLANGLPDRTDWFDETYTTGKTQNYQVAVSNGNEKMKYYLSAGYLKEQEKMVWMLVAFSTKGCTDK